MFNFSYTVVSGEMRPDLLLHWPIGALFLSNRTDLKSLKIIHGGKNIGGGLVQWLTQRTTDQGVLG